MSEFHRLRTYLESKGTFTEEEFAFLEPLYLPPRVAARTPSTYFIDAVENSNLLLFDAASHQRAVERVPGYAAGFRDGLQRHAAAKDQQIVNALSTSGPEGRQEYDSGTHCHAQRPSRIT